LARIGAGRRAARAEKVLTEGIQDVAETYILQPLTAELSSRMVLAESLRVVRGG
jgi:hypothetical protein